MTTEDTFLGGGAMGQVWKHKSRSPKTDVARKVFSSEHGYKAEAHYMSDCRLLADAGFRYANFVVAYFGDGHLEPGKYMIDMELADGDLFSLAFTSSGIPTHCPLLPTEKHFTKVIDNALSGLVFLHEECGIMHNDIKPQNLLWFRDGTVKIGDLGSCTYVSNKRCGMGTLGYAAPEAYSDDFCRGDAEADSHGGYGKSDVFSLGIALCFVADGGFPYNLPESVLSAFRHLNGTCESQREQAMQQLCATASEFYAHDFKALTLTGQNLNSVSMSAALLVAEMTQPFARRRQSASKCLLKLRVYDRGAAKCADAKTQALGPRCVDAQMDVFCTAVAETQALGSCCVDAEPDVFCTAVENAERGTEMTEAADARV